MKRLGQIIFLGIFLGALSTEVMLRLAGVRAADASSDADALPSAKADSGGGQVPAFVSAWKRSFEDHLALKLPAKILDSGFRYRVLQSSSDDRVSLGSQGWLFTHGLGRTAEADIERDFSGKSKLTDREVDFNVALLKARSDKFKAQHIPYFVVVVPDKQSVYPEFLPSWLLPAPNTGRLRFLKQAAKAGLDVLDLGQAVLKAKLKRQDYRRSDTHWNLWGAQAGYEAILRHWAAVARPGAAPSPAQPYGWESLHARDVPALGGDLSSLLGIQGMLLEPADSLKVPGFEGVIFSQLPVREADPGTLASFKGAKLLFFGDSYSVLLAPLLRRHAFGAGFFNNRLSFPEDEILAARPKLVIEEFAERRFISFPPLQGDVRNWLPDAKAEGLRAALLGL